ncbi:MAG: imidazolonepropionase [Chitinophagales bacterium]|nr:MAG: imidazolonepropionase [Chitinophagales bacterium]
MHGIILPWVNKKRMLVFSGKMFCTWLWSVGVFFCSAFLFLSGSAQVPTPAPPQNKPVVIRGATIHTGNGDVIENGVLRFENGKITAVGQAGLVMPDDITIEIDAAGKHVYPGLIAVNTTLGLTEIDAVRATRDFMETGEFNPNVRTIIAYNTDSRIIPTVRSNGILLAQITPSGGLLSGMSSVVQLDAWNWEDAAYKTDIGIHVRWPSRLLTTGWWGEPGPLKANEKYGEDIRRLHDFFAQAKAYAENHSPSEKNLRFESMRGLFNQQKKLFVHVDRASEILEAIDFCKRYGVKMVIVGGRDTHLVAERLRAENIPVIVLAVFELPDRADDDTDEGYRLPFLLQNAGVEFCIGVYGSWEQRSLPFVAGAAAAYGLSKEDALATITSRAAKILGIDATTGTLQPGKDATLIIASGDILDIKSSNVEMAFIQGRQIDLDDPHKALYRKFRSRYE